MILSVGISDVHSIYMEQHSYIMNSVEKKPYDQEKVTFLETVTSRVSNVSYLQYSLGKVAEEAEFMINELDTSAQIADISIFLLGEEPLLSLSKITELSANALEAKKSI